MINGSRVNRRCGICKWLCLWCAAWSPVRYHTGGYSMSWIQKREGGWYEKGSWGFVLMQAHVTVGISSPTDAGSCPIKGDCKMNPMYYVLGYDWIIDGWHFKQWVFLFLFVWMDIFLWLWHFCGLGSSSTCLCLNSLHYNLYQVILDFSGLSAFQI